MPGWRGGATVGMCGFVCGDRVILFLVFIFYPGRPTWGRLFLLWGGVDLCVICGIQRLGCW